MTAAIAHLVRPSRRASLRGRSAHALAVLTLVLPVPFCAALGLSLPLPASVARIAAKIVPFSNSALLDVKEEQVLGARGSIVPVAGELPAANARSAIDPRGSLAAQVPHHAGGAGGAQGGNIGGTTTASPNDITPTRPAMAAQEHGASTPRQSEPISTISATTPPGGSTPSPGTGSTPPPGGSEPVPPSGTPTVVDTAAAAVAPVVGTVSNTVTTAIPTVTDTAAAAVGTAGGVVTGALPPVFPKKP
jgi:hypothetical protein